MSIDASRPTPLPVNAAEIPDSLKAQPAWVCWRYELRDGRWTKPPLKPDGTGYAKTTDPASWGGFDEALATYQRGHADGVGIVLVDGVAGVDIDHALTDGHAPETWAAEITERFNAAYIERSPGGDGLRIFCRGKPQRSGKGGPDNRLEVYAKGSPRYLTVTGQRWPGASGEVTEQQAALDWLHGRFMAKETGAKRERSGFGSTKTDDEIIRSAREAKNGAKFAAVFTGGGGEDRSAGDQALCNLLAFWTRDPAQIDRIFRRSGLMRDKWDERRGAQTYGELTVASALNFVTENHATPRAVATEARESRQPAEDAPGGDPGALLGRCGAALAPDVRPPSDYPSHALGALAPACEAIAEGGQLAPAMAGQCLLATAALLTQSLADVRTLAGVKPLSIFALTIAASGEGKSTAEQAALAPIHDRQRADAKAHAAQMGAAEQASATRKGGAPLPDQPREPYRVMRDGTVEGVRRAFAQGMPTQGIFTSEAAVLLSGYGMTAENRAKTAATFNGLWDGGELSVARAGAGRVQLYDRRLSAHWLIQPAAARETLHDQLLADIGFWPRFLVAWPEAGAPRKARPFHPDRDSRIREFWRQCSRLLTYAVGEDCGGLPVIEATAEAERLACEFYERMEVAAKTEGGALVDVRPFAARATEHLFRVAGVLAAFAERREIDLQAMRNAAELTLYSVDTWRAIFGDREKAEAARLALRLFEWLLNQPGMRTTETAVLHIGPKALRSRSSRDAALATLAQAGQIVREGDTWGVIP